MLLVGPKSAKLSLDVSTPLERLGSLPLILTTNPNSLRRMIDFELRRAGLGTRVCAEADTVPLLSDLVMAGVGYTVMPSCGVLSLVKSGHLSASSLSGLRITWTIARPHNRNLTLAARRLSEVVFSVTKDLIASGDWALAELEFGQIESAARYRKSLDVAVLRVKIEQALLVRGLRRATTASRTTIGRKP
jgi:LysR family nitrogen assimilation transcriptional regulator